MGDVWIRTADNVLIRADQVTAISSSAGSNYETTGYQVHAELTGNRNYNLIQNRDRVGDADERRSHAGQMQDALLLALDSAARSQGDGFSMATTGDNSKVISYNEASEHWLITEAYKLAGNFKPEFS